MFTFGKILRESRKAQGFTLRTLADRVGVSYPYISDLEKGNRLPSEETCGALANVLGLNPDEMLIRAGKVPSDLLSIIASKPNEARAVLMALK